VPLPPADVDVDAGVVTALLRAQHPDLAGPPLRPEAIGWDNVTFRLGDDLAVRLPRIAGAVDLLRLEQEWLPRLAPDQAPRLGAFLRALHRPPSPDAPRNSWRGIPLDAVTGVKTRLAALKDALPGGSDAHAELARLWQVARTTPRDVPEALVHADLHPRNVVVDGGRLAAVLDWGDLTVGDPATDLAAAWMLLPVSVHDGVWAAYGEVTAATLDRARGWAVHFGTALLETGIEGTGLAGPDGGGDAVLAAAGRATLARLTDG